MVHSPAQAGVSEPAPALVCPLSSASRTGIQLDDKFDELSQEESEVENDGKGRKCEDEGNSDRNGGDAGKGEIEGEENGEENGECGGEGEINSRAPNTLLGKGQCITFLKRKDSHVLFR